MFRSRLFALYALKLSESKQYRKAWNPKTNADLFAHFKNHWLDRKGFRLWFPALPNAVPAKAQSQTQIAVEKTIDALRINGATFSVLDYIGNKAVNNKTSQIISISKLLSRNKSDLLEKFNNDPVRARKSYDSMVIISRHPHDVAGMSTDRGWTSCMNIRSGVNRHYVLDDVQAGTLIAYLVRKEDTNIKKPSARVLIKPFVETDYSAEQNGEDETGSPFASFDSAGRRILWVKEESQYGTHSAILDAVVEDFLEKINVDISGTFCIPDSLYEDSEGTAEAIDGKVTRSPRVSSVDDLVLALEPFLEDGDGGEVLSQAGYRYLAELKESDYGEMVRDSAEEQKDMVRLLLNYYKHSLLYPITDSFTPDYSYADLALAAAHYAETDANILENFVKATEQKFKNSSSFVNSLKEMAAFSESSRLTDSVYPENYDYNAVGLNAAFIAAVGKYVTDEAFLKIVKDGFFSGLYEPTIAECLSYFKSNNAFTNGITNKALRRWENPSLFQTFLEELPDANSSDAVNALTDALFNQSRLDDKASRLAFLLGMYPQNWNSSEDRLKEHMTPEALAALNDIPALIDFYRSLDNASWTEYDNEERYFHTWQWLYDAGYFKNLSEEDQAYFDESISPELDLEEDL